LIETISPSEIKINPEYDALIPKLTEEENDSLKQSLENNGQLVPVVVTKKNSIVILLDGHHRFRILRNLKKDIKVRYLEFEDSFSEKKYVIEVNLNRRHLSDISKVKLAMKLVEIEEIESKKRKQKTFPKKGQQGFQRMSMQPCMDTGNTDAIVAKKTGVKQRNVAKIKKILKHGSEELIRKVEQGEKSINGAERDVSILLAKTKDVSLPPGKYNVIIVDPPYRYDFERSGAPPYPTLTTEEIINLQDKDGRPVTDAFASDIVMFMWAPRPKVFEAEKILRAWGFEPKTLKIWRKVRNGKPQRGNGHYYWSTTELLILSTKGKPGKPKFVPEDFLETPRGKRHSEKPEEIRKEIEQMYPDGMYLELFARKRIKNWAVWGNQIWDENEEPSQPEEQQDKADRKRKSKSKKLDDF